MENDNFIGKKFLQNCGDFLLVLRKTDKKQGNAYLYECEFQKYPFKLLALKQNILKNKVNNPEIENQTFIGQIFPQNCGDSLKVIKKIEQKQGKNILYECEFQKYPYKCLATKINIQQGQINNPQIEQVEFIDKIWPQNCGDSLRIIKKSDKKKNNNYLWECEFIKSYFKILATKGNILSKNIDNPTLPWRSKENLENFINKNFKNKKPTLIELLDILQLYYNISYSHLVSCINKLSLNEKISYSYEKLENDIKNFIFFHKKENIIQNYWFKNIQKEIDIFISDLKLGFEFNGNYWHSELYKSQFYHQEKSLLCKKENIQLIHIFEYEWENKNNIIQSLIKSKLGIFIKKIYARKCIIKELDYKEYAKFCNENHLQGECGAKVKLGLFYQNELVQIISFGVPRFTDKYEWEIIRECSKLGYYILGGKEKLWKYFLKKYNPNSIISYCDFSKFNGDSYLRLGFKLKQLNKPGFVWWDSKTKQVYQRSPWKHQEMKEKYIKIYDCGQLVFIYKK